jgi:O-Antigen ligase
MKRLGWIKTALLLAIVAACLFGFVLCSQSGTFREFQAILLSVKWILLACVAVWCGSFIFLTFSKNDLPLIGLLLIAITAFLIDHGAGLWTTDGIIFLAGVTMGRGATFFIGGDVTSLTLKHGNKLETPYIVSYFLIGLVALLAFASWWHLDLAGVYYHGPRWMGLWDNPNIYGMLMGAGLMLAIGLLIAKQKSESGNLKPKKTVGTITVRDSRSLCLRIFLWIAAGMMAVGLFFSYSRGAWVGAAVGLLYLAKANGKFKWHIVLSGILVAAAVVFFFWHSTADTDAWYLKRLDLSRPSAQHRLSAWRGALQMMRDHPFGVGWNKAVEIYNKNYSPPEGGAAAITMNSHLMLGTELGLPGLLCFIVYIWLKFTARIADSSQIGSRAGALALLVAFWFDGGLFTLATASVFWILMELGASDLASVSTSLRDDNSASGNQMVSMRDQNP